MFNDNQHNAPPELLAKAYEIALYFAERGIKDWALGPIQKRKTDSVLHTPPQGWRQDRPFDGDNADAR